jgi:tRNA pseudouridine32 synthase/23S rRNA pseudouridine746 synthase
MTRGKPSVTRWRELGSEKSGRHTRLLLEPVTGRTHQLRVHLMALGHPILGDMLYASDEALTASPRLLLHATDLSLPHPITGETLHWHSAAPF